VAYNIADLFEHAVDAVADRTALIAGDDSRTFAELEEGANRIAHHLAAHGVGPGDHVGIYGVNSLEWVEALVGAFKLRAVPINVNFRYVADELVYLFDNADLTALVVDREFAPRVAAVRDQVPGLAHVVHVDPPAGAPPAITGPPPSPDEIDAAVAALGSVPWADALAGASPERDFGPRSPDDHYILYTGGTTGMPKGVMWRQEDVFFALGGGIDATTNEPVTSEHDLAEKARATETPIRSLCLPPLMHGTAQWSVMRFLFDGSVSVLMRRFDPYEAWRAARHGINNLMMTGDAMGRPLIEALEEMDGEDLDLSALFVVASTAAVFTTPVKERFLATMPHLLVVDAIGSTETGSNGMAVVAPGGTMRGGPTVAPARDAVVLDEDLHEMAPGTGVVGRLARKGNIPLGYYKDEAKTKATFVTGPSGDRYVVAGDMALLEEDGTITLLGRGSGCVNTGGEKVFPEEVEGVLKAHPDVFDVLVVGVPDERWGQRVAAVVQPRPGRTVTLDDLDRHCRGRLAGYKIPRQLTVVPAVERSPSGKPDYPWARRAAVDDAGATATPSDATAPA
jgi:acyl-CoA synthetase (AMP-forming)/AMP-acid ligase II